MRHWIAVAALLLSACNYNKVKDAASRGGTQIGAELFSQPDFATVMNAVIGPKCVSCHSDSGGNQGGTNLESYSAVRSKLSRVLYRSLETLDMPPRSPLGENEARLLSNWADSGAPETVVGVGEKPDLSLEKGPNNWVKVRDKIFEPKCFACHSGANLDGGLDLSDLAAVRAKAPAIFERVILKGDMPVEPLPAVTPPERRVLLKWFDAGLPE
jgi:uncharacterized membrane protein